jgi:hypothetical protein
VSASSSTSEKFGLRKASTHTPLIGSRVVFWIASQNLIVVPRRMWLSSIHALTRMSSGFAGLDEAMAVRAADVGSS